MPGGATIFLWPGVPASPSKRVEVMTPRGLQFRSWEPVVVQDDPDYLAILHACAKEHDRLQARIDATRAQFFPQNADVLLKAWEALVQTTIEPAGKTLDERRATVLAMLSRSRSDPSGAAWQLRASALIGAGWSYEEHLPGDPSSPAANTLRVTLPFPPAGDLYLQTRGLLRSITPAHLDLQLVYAGGFVLDESLLDEDVFP